MAIAESVENYEGEEAHINASQQGVIQYPREFARCLQLFAEQRPASYFEVGCYNGATASLATAYLQRFNPPSRRRPSTSGRPSSSTTSCAISFRCATAWARFPTTSRTSVSTRSSSMATTALNGLGRIIKTSDAMPCICAVHDVNHAPYRERPAGWWRARGVGTDQTRRRRRIYRDFRTSKPRHYGHRRACAGGSRTPETSLLASAVKHLKFLHKQAVSLASR